MSALLTHFAAVLLAKACLIYIYKIQTSVFLGRLRSVSRIDKDFDDDYRILSIEACGVGIYRAGNLFYLLHHRSSRCSSPAVYVVSCLTGNIVERGIDIDRKRLCNV